MAVLLAVSTVLNSFNFMRFRLNSSVSLNSLKGLFNRVECKAKRSLGGGADIHFGRSARALDENRPWRIRPGMMDT